MRLVALILLVALMSLCECALGASAADAPPPAPASPASGAWESVRHTARRVWEFELLEVGEHTLSVSQVVLTVLVVLLGLLISRLITRSLRRHLLRRVRITETAAAAVERVLFYLLVEEHGRVLARPEPILVFHDFGDNSLVFEVYFWVEVATMMDVKVICSDVRFRIDKLFREGGIAGGLVDGSLAEALAGLQDDPIRMGPFLWNNWHATFAVAFVARLLTILWLVRMPDPGAAAARSLARHMGVNVYNGIVTRLFYSLRVFGWQQRMSRAPREKAGVTKPSRSGPPPSPAGRRDFAKRNCRTMAAETPSPGQSAPNERSKL